MDAYLNRFSEDKNMLKEYDQITAIHYSAYRPSLHSKILNEHFKGKTKHRFGLDVGCGTGHSSIALAHFCDKVFGIDPSKEMLHKSLTHPSVEYALHNTINLDFAHDYFDIITFAGSLYYAKSQQLLNEIVRVSKDSAEILVYDFEIFLEEILDKLNLVIDSKQKSEYNHEANFSGLDQKNITIEKELKKLVEIEMSISDLTHILLSSKDNYGIFEGFFGEDDLYNKVLQKLHSVINTKKTTLETMTYLTVYKVIK